MVGKEALRHPWASAPSMVPGTQQVPHLLNKGKKKKEIRRKNQDSSIVKKPRKVTRVGQKNCDKLSSMNVFINSLWLAKSWSSKDVHILLPGTYEYGTWKRDFMDVFN